VSTLDGLIVDGPCTNITLLFCGGLLKRRVVSLGNFSWIEADPVYYIRIGLAG
jgi:hypothetical protein